jgi:hypothetical protein
VLDHWRDRLNDFRPAPPHTTKALRYVSQRLDDGFTAEDLCAAIENLRISAVVELHAVPDVEQFFRSRKLLVAAWGRGRVGRVLGGPPAAAFPPESPPVRLAATETDVRRWEATPLALPVAARRWDAPEGLPTQHEIELQARDRLTASELRERDLDRGWSWDFATEKRIVIRARPTIRQLPPRHEEKALEAVCVSTLERSGEVGPLLSGDDLNRLIEAQQAANFREFSATEGRNYQFMTPKAAVCTDIGTGVGQ